MNDREFRALLSMTMASDPNPAGEVVDEIIKELLDREAFDRGYSSWYVAYHEYKLD